MDINVRTKVYTSLYVLISTPCGKCYVCRKQEETTNVSLKQYDNLAAMLMCVLIIWLILFSLYGPKLWYCIGLCYLVEIQWTIYH